MSDDDEGFEILKVDIDSVKPRDGNPNVMEGHLFQFLTDAIQKRGMLQPILVDKDLVIIDGEHRWRASKQAKRKRITVVQVDMSSLEARQTLVNMNLVHGEFDSKKLGVLIEAMIDEAGRADVEKALAMDKSVIENLVKHAEGEQVERAKKKETDEVPDKDKMPDNAVRVQEGDIWQIGAHKVMCASSLEPDNISLLFEGTEPGMCKLAFLDPPQNAGVEYNSYKDDIPQPEYAANCNTWIQNALGITPTLVIHATKYALLDLMGGLRANKQAWDTGMWISQHIAMTTSTIAQFNNW